MRCYNLVFNFEIFCHNYGSIITLIFFIIYVLFMIYYCCKDITPLKVSISKIVCDEEEDEKYNKINKLKSDIFKAKSVKTSKNLKNAKSEKSKKSGKTSKTSKSKKKKQNKSTKEPPKKIRAKKEKNNSLDKSKGNDHLKLVDLMKHKRKSIKNKKHNEEEESIQSDKVRKRKSIVDYQNEHILKTRENLLNKETIQKINENNNENKADIYQSGKILKSNEEKLYNRKDEKEQEKYDHYELNHMGYFDASELDKRGCLRTYWSVILREHYVIFTFFSRNDINLFYIKIERFFIIICTEMTMNGMFFVHETMYKKKTGDTSFAQKIPQIIFSLLVSHAIEIILCYLGMTDVHYYQIKALPIEEKNEQRVFDIIKCVKRKLTGFFIFTFLVFLFHWYFISAFCAVYQNTQVIYLRDSAIAIGISLIDPFIIYGLTCLIRALSLLLCCKKKLICLYKLSQLIPIF